MPKDIAASIRQKLRDLARTRHEDFDYVLRQYVMQRLLYRLGCSEHSNQFLLKGALLFWIWNQDFHRPTRDIDLLSFGNNDVAHLVNVFRQIISQDMNDGLLFDSKSVTGIEIKEAAEYPGVRLIGFAFLAKARVPFQIDIGYGDAVFPIAERFEVPSFLDFPAPKLRVYPVYSVIAEKFQAMVMLGVANSRMKDFYDIQIIAQTMELDGALLSQAVKATFERRKTLISKEPLYIFSDEFAQEEGKSVQWRAFLNKNGLNIESEFAEIVGEIQFFLQPIYQSIAEKHLFQLHWSYNELKWK